MAPTPQNAWKFIPFVHHIVLFSSFQIFSPVWKWRQGHTGKKSLCLMILNSELWSRCGVFLFIVFLFLERSREQSERHPKHQIFLMFIIIVYVLWNPFYTTEIKDRIQLYQCSLQADGKTCNYFSLIFSFPSHNQTQYAFSSFTWVRTISISKNSIS